MPENNSPRLRTNDAGAYVGLSRSTLEKFRMTGEGPRFGKLGRIVVYDKVDLDAWVESKKVQSNSEADARRAAPTVITPSKKSKGIAQRRGV